MFTPRTQHDYPGKEYLSDQEFTGQMSGHICARASHYFNVGKRINSDKSDETIYTCFALHMADAPGVRAAVKTELSYRSDITIVFFLTDNKNTNNASVALAS